MFLPSRELRHRSIVDPRRWQQDAGRMSPVVMNRIGRDLSLLSLCTAFIGSEISL
jgi:hypothetical protein